MTLVTQRFLRDVNADDGVVGRQSYTWPPTDASDTYIGGDLAGLSSLTVDDTGGATARRASGQIFGIGYPPGGVHYKDLQVGLIRFLMDTDENGDPPAFTPGAITSAWLEVAPSGVSNDTADATRQLQVEWFAGAWPIDASDWTATASGSAHAGTSLLTLAAVSGTTNLMLSSPSGHITTSGYVGMRLHVTGGDPGGPPGAVTEFSSSPAAVLVVEYDDGAGATVSGPAGFIPLVGTEITALDVVSSTSEAATTADALLATARWPTITLTAKLKAVHWAAVREGDIIRIAAPQLGLRGRTQCGVYRILARTYSGTDPLLELTLQWLWPLDESVPARARATHPIPPYNTGVAMRADPARLLRTLQGGAVRSVKERADIEFLGQRLTAAEVKLGTL